MSHIAVFDRNTTFQRLIILACSSDQQKTVVSWCCIQSL